MKAQHTYWILFSLIILNSCKPKAQQQDNLTTIEKDLDTLQSTRWDTFAWANLDTIFFVYDETFGISAIPVAMMKRALEVYPGLAQEVFDKPENVFRMETAEGDDELDLELEGEEMLIYTYLLREKNKTATQITTRKNLIAIYQYINRLYQLLAHGGTGYMHMLEKIPALAEYEVQFQHQYSNLYNDRGKLFIKAKHNYLRKLRAMAKAREDSDFDLSDDDKKENYKDVGKVLEHLEKQISNQYYLNLVKKYEKENYSSNFD